MARAGRDVANIFSRSAIAVAGLADVATIARGRFTGPKTNGLTEGAHCTNIMTTRPAPIALHGIGPQHILVADDDELVRVAMSRLLEREGYICHQVCSGAEALNIMASTDVSVVVADINMEGNTRLELLEQLRAKAPHVSIILVTGHPTIETAAAAPSLRVAAYLLKPVNADALIATVRYECEQHALFHILSERRQRQEEALQSMRALESAFTHSTGNAAATTLQSYVSLAFDQTVESLLDLKAVVGTLAKEENASDRFSSARPLVLVNAIHETIEVLERTRTSFKSKELATLRRKLEDLLVKQTPSSNTATREARTFISGASINPLGIMLQQE